MRPPGSFKIARASRRGSEPGPRRLATRAPHTEADLVDLLGDDMRVQKILDSLRSEIAQAGPDHSLRVRQVFATPREIYRIELVVPAMSYQRTTLLDRAALEELLADEEVQRVLSHGSPGGG